MSHPAAFLEYRVRRRVRSRIHVEPHEFLTDHVQLRIIDGDADLDILLDLDAAQQLGRTISDLVSALVASQPAPIKVRGA